MKLKQTLLVATAALAFSAGLAVAQTANPTVDTILANDFGGATNVRVHVGLFTIKVEATAADGSMVENTYSSSGTLIKSEVISNGMKSETYFDPNGNPIASSDDDDEDEMSDDSDDDDNDDSDDDDGDHHGGSSGHGSGHDDDDD